MSRENCVNCKFYMAVNAENGVCRRYPPAVVCHPAAVGKGGEPLFAFSFPGMRWDGWCGEHERQIIIDPNIGGSS